jgi:hypothetical protein
MCADTSPCSSRLRAGVVFTFVVQDQGQLKGQLIIASTTPSSFKLERMQALPHVVNPAKFFRFLRLRGLRFDNYDGNAWKLFSAFFGKDLINDHVITMMLTSPQHFSGSLDDLACRLRGNLRVACDDRYLATHGACITESNYHAIADAVLRIFASVVARKSRHAPPPMKSRRRRLPFDLFCRTKPTVVA